MSKDELCCEGKAIHAVSSSQDRSPQDPEISTLTARCTIAARQVRPSKTWSKADTVVGCLRLESQ